MVMIMILMIIIILVMLILSVAFLVMAETRSTIIDLRDSMIRLIKLLRAVLVA